MPNSISRSITRHGRKLLIASGVLVAALVAALALSAATGDASQGRTVRSNGDNQFVPNVKIASTLRFSPGHISINSGETLTFEHSDKTEEPHTLTIVDQADVPATEDEVFGCGEPGTVCDEVFQLFTEEPTDSVFLNAPGTGAGIDGRLDTLFVLPGQSISEVVTAPSGTTLYFICVIHAWMQGQIDVK